ncbi:30S ribosomal protein S8 [Candidatus Bathyarchaeota archaeon]|jgi:small subunit ribosomal protein S8|nr:30S ribosomal protein S8 [Candidatus Bathyarchaeota archaeon]MCK4400664.1 30S ribosomal protein S8 [Candidatus Bathyarchaeota archaeon]MCK4437454.1 30S ribosomal protein S8 [Candidatus Bathyarchaeota archaeon]
MDPLVNALNTIMSHEGRRKNECIITPASDLVGRVLRLIQGKGYVGEIEFIDDGRQGKFRVQLFGRINECKAVTPRFKTRVFEMEKWEKRFLPSRNLGVVILSTPRGIMDHNQAKEENVGGVLLAYVY